MPTNVLPNILIEWPQKKFYSMEILRKRIGSDPIAEDASFFLVRVEAFILEHHHMTWWNKQVKRYWSCRQGVLPWNVEISCLASMSLTESHGNRLEWIVGIIKDDPSVDYQWFSFSMVPLSTSWNVSPLVSPYPWVSAYTPMLRIMITPDQLSGGHYTHQQTWNVRQLFLSFWGTPRPCSISVQSKTRKR